MFSAQQFLTMLALCLVQHSWKLLRYHVNELDLIPHGGKAIRLMLMGQLSLSSFHYYWVMLVTLGSSY